MYYGFLSDTYSDQSSLLPRRYPDMSDVASLIQVLVLVIQNTNINIKYYY